VTFTVQQARDTVGRERSVCVGRLRDADAATWQRPTRNLAADLVHYLPGP
jgi:hypothetical protein